MGLPRRLYSSMLRIHFCRVNRVSRMHCCRPGILRLVREFRVSPYIDTWTGTSVLLSMGVSFTMFEYDFSRLDVAKVNVKD